MSKFIKSKYLELNLKIPKLINEGKTIKEMSKILNVSVSTINRRCKELSLSVPNHHNALKFDNTVFDYIDSEEKAYWLGFLYADGNVHSSSNIVSLSLKGDDVEHLQKFRQFLKAAASVKMGKIQVNNKEYKICKFSVCDKHFKQQLASLGCVPKKSLILQFPSLDVFQRKELVYDFIRGYIDGDGCLTFSKNGRLQLSIAGTKEFLNGILSIFPNKFSMYKPKNVKNNIWILSNCGANADDVTYTLYAKATMFLQRKYDRFAVLNRKVQNNYGAKTVKAEMPIPC